ncbi:hypothetical protein AGLY_014449 [Aphis glycines]|uniref:RING-type domain-containing protein n=1 Tax=Aphis glycines TaxID=307491 RepID=A0A6G0T3X0_APHGL|nr:hypothetical protein AGLY_014449 [Aphis glycines]
MSHTESSNSQLMVKNNVELNPSKPIQSTQVITTPDNTADTTDSTRSCTQINNTTSTASHFQPYSVTAVEIFNPGAKNIMVPIIPPEFNDGNIAEILNDLHEIADLPVSSHSSNELSPNPGNSVNGTNSSVNEPKSLKVTIRTRNNPDHHVVLSDPNIIRMHKSLQRYILKIQSREQVIGNSGLAKRIDEYMYVLRNTILLTDISSESISKLILESIPTSLCVDHTFNPLLDYTFDPVPVEIIQRIQNGHAIKELTYCVVCLEDNKAGILLEPCKHYNMCSNCFQRLATWKCPICRTPITNIKVYI